MAGNENSPCHETRCRCGLQPQDKELQPLGGRREQIQEMATNVFLEVEQVTDYEGAEVIHNGGRTGLLVRTGRDGDGHTE